MVTVIMPTLNAEEQIASVVDSAKRQANGTEVIVADDKSIDSKVRIARQNGAKVQGR